MSNPQIQLCLVLHNHQPVGNFDGVFEEAYQDSYLPFLEVFEPYTDLKISLHTSGPLMQWLQANHPDYLIELRNWSKPVGSKSSAAHFMNRSCR